MLTRRRPTARVLIRANPHPSRPPRQPPRRPTPPRIRPQQPPTPPRIRPQQPPTPPWLRPQPPSMPRPRKSPRFRLPRPTRLRRPRRRRLRHANGLREPPPSPPGQRRRVTHRLATQEKGDGVPRHRDLAAAGREQPAYGPLVAHRHTNIGLSEPEARRRYAGRAADSDCSASRLGYGETEVNHLAFGEPTPVTSSQPGPICRLESWLNVRTLYTRPSVASTPFT